MGRNDHKKETLSSLHRKQMQEIEEAEADLPSLKERLEILEEQDKSEEDIGQIKETIDQIKAKRVNYLLKNGELLYRFTE